MTPRTVLPQGLQEQLLLLADRLQEKRKLQHVQLIAFKDALLQQLTMMAQIAWSWPRAGKGLEHANEIERLNDHWENLLEDYDDANADLSPLGEACKAVLELLLQQTFDCEHLERLWSPLPEQKAEVTTPVYPSVLSFLKTFTQSNAVAGSTLVNGSEEAKDEIIVPTPGR